MEYRSVACLFRVKLEELRESSDALPVSPTSYTCEFRVAARDAEAAVISARLCMRERLQGIAGARVVSVEIIEGIDACSRELCPHLMKSI